MTKKPGILLALAAAAMPAAAQAQLRFPVIVPLGRQGPQPPGPAQPPPQVVRGNLIAAAGSDTVYFSRKSSNLDANAAATLTAQARWLVANPFVTVRLEGHGDSHDSRDYALAIGERRANAVRDFLVLQGVAPQRISVTSWGKEHPGTLLVGRSVVAAGPRVQTVIQ
ncbi:MAG TPA: OmpA family protein [Sphingomicrobium sp.]|nr:OmpA family protein [Sphingomicrobium sp.]